MLKEGVVQDPANRERSCRCCALPAPARPDNEPRGEPCRLRGAHEPAARTRIYYVIAESVEAARGQPASSACKERGLEVLLLAERIDEWVMGQLTDYEGKRFKDAARGDLELGGLASEADRKQHDAELKESKGLLKRVKDALGERVTEVRVSERLQGLSGLPGAR